MRGTRHPDRSRREPCSKATPAKHFASRLFGGILALLLSVAIGAAASAAEFKQGGTLRVGVASLSTADTLDPAQASTVGGYVIARQLYDTLTEYGTDGQVALRLAETMQPEGSADVWVVKLRQAVWQDGKPVTADDLIYTIKRILDPKTPLPPASSLPFVDPDKLTKIDGRTVSFKLRYPTMVFRDAFTSPTMAILPRGYDPKHPIGSGPFVLDSLEPGTRITLTANKSYWKSGEPHVDKLQIISFPDSVSQVNALIGGQIDVASSIDPSLVPVVKQAGDGFAIFEYQTTGTLTWQMNAKKKPFDDVRVRQALRLAVDRQQLIDQVYDGHAAIGNDVFSPYDEGYNRELPQRKLDIAEAKRLLKEAGYPDGVKVVLTAAPIQPTADRQNEVLIQQAAKAGFDITFNKVDEATYYGDSYGTYPLSLSFWGQLSIFDQAAFTIVNNAPYNATKWQDNEYNDLYQKAIRTVDKQERIKLVHEMQKIEYDRGPYIVAVFLTNISAYSSKLAGYQPYPNSDGASGYNFYEIGFRK